jgi:Co/Zn/Cd efflux system component
MKEIKVAIRELALHDLHFWTLTSGLNSASVHVRAASTSPRGEVLPQRRSAE